MNAIRKITKIILLLLLLFSFTGCKGKDWTRTYEQALIAYRENNLNYSLSLLSAIPENSSTSFQARLLEGKIYFCTEEFEEAFILFSKLSKHYPSSSEARIWLLRSEFFSGRSERMEALLQNELLLNSGDWRLWYLSALCSEQKGRYDSMLSDLRHCELLLSEGNKVYSKLSFLWDLLGNKEKSIDYKVKEAAVKSILNDLPQGDVK